MLKLDLPLNISKTADPSRNDPVLGKHMGRLKRTKLALISGIIFILSGFFITYLFFGGTRWASVTSGQKISPIVIFAAVIIVTISGIWFIIGYFRTKTFDIYQNGLKVGKEKIPYKKIKKSTLVQGNTFTLTIYTAEKTIKFSSLAVSKSSLHVLEQIAKGTR